MFSSTPFRCRQARDGRTDDGHRRLMPPPYGAKHKRHRRYDFLTWSRPQSIFHWLFAMFLWSDGNNGMLRTEQLGRHSWKRLRCWQAPDDDDDDGNSASDAESWIRLYIVVSARHVNLDYGPLNVVVVVWIIIVSLQQTPVKEWSKLFSEFKFWFVFVLPFVLFRWNCT